MKTAMALMLLGGALLWTLPAMAAPAAPDWVGVSAGWFDMGDADNGLGLGVSYGHPLNTDSALMLDASWGNGSTDVLDGEAGYINTSLDVWGIGLSYLRMADYGKTKFFYGAGPDWFDVKGTGISESSFGGHVIIGVPFAENWCAEARYVFGTDFHDNNVDGFRLSVGYSWKLR